MIIVLNYYYYENNNNNLIKYKFYNFLLNFIK